MVYARRARRRGRQAGLVLLDVLVGSFIVLLIAMGIFSLVPLNQRSQQLADERSKAIQMANRMVEHLQLLKPVDLNVGTLTQLGLIDTGQSDTGVYKFTNVPLDDGSGYSPAKALKGAKAEMSIYDIGSGSKMVELLITWKSPTGKSAWIETGTIVGGYK